MAYLLDRQRAIRATEIIAIIAVRRRGVRSDVLLRDGSRYQTLTRPRTVARTRPERQLAKRASWSKATQDGVGDAGRGESR